MIMDSIGNEKQDPQTARADTPGVLNLLQGIIEDIKTLASQQVRLAKHELQFEGARATSMIVAAIFAVILATLCMMLLFIASVAALHEVAGLPVWMSCCIMAFVVLVVTISLFVYLKQQAQRLRLLPFRSLQTVKEDIRWIKEWITSPRM
ncbi:MAG: phage holin family protein [Nitrospira sp.]